MAPTHADKAYNKPTDINSARLATVKAAKSAVVNVLLIIRTAIHAETGTIAFVPAAGMATRPIILQALATTPLSY